MAITFNSCRTNVCPTPCLIESGWHYVGMCRVCFGLRTLDQQQINRWQLRWADEQNDVAPTSFVSVATIMPMLAHRKLLSGLIALIFKQLRINGTGTI